MHIVWHRSPNQRRGHGYQYIPLIILTLPACLLASYYKIMIRLLYGEVRELTFYTDSLCVADDVGVLYACCYDFCIAEGR